MILFTNVENTQGTKNVNNSLINMTIITTLLSCKKNIAYRMKVYVNQMIVTSACFVKR